MHLQLNNRQAKISTFMTDEIDQSYGAFVYLDDLKEVSTKYDVYGVTLPGLVSEAKQEAIKSALRPVSQDGKSRLLCVDAMVLRSSMNPCGNHQNQHRNYHSRPQDRLCA
jgi:hypothetical protein